MWRLAVLRGGTMPYKKIEDLPDPLRKKLPVHAQRIYRSAFNNAYIHYKNEVIAHKVAWNAVKHMYEKSESGSWKRKKSA